ncbi:hypothetical protein HYV58_01925, partial [Candidatus Peregrinibacteria bacterium]|nr:hypothetical protein [Candidatus Peregrinibacteria bacterium]
MEKNTTGKALCYWRAPQYLHHEKTALWFAVFGAVIFSFVLYGLKTGAWTFSVAVVVFAGTYYLYERHRPEPVDIKLSKHSLMVGKKRYPYSHLKNFWIVDEPPFPKKLYLRAASRLAPDFYIPLGNADSDAVREVLSKRL